MTHKILALIIACIITITSFAQTFKPQKNAPSLLRSDLFLLRDTIQKIHPSIYRYQSKATIDHIFDSTFAIIRDSMTVPDFYAITSFIIASIGDGHTNCTLPNSVIKEYYSNTKVFPAMVMFINNKTFIFCCKQNIELEQAEILSIDNNSMSEIIQRLFSYIQSDGFIQSHKNWEILEKFQLLFSIVYGEKSDYNITYKTKSGDVKSTTLHADIIKNIFCKNPFPRPDKYLQLAYKPNNIAILSIKTFLNDFLDKTEENFSKFLDSAFNDIKIKKVQNLIIDIRSNQGGNDGNGKLLYSYLTAKPFKYYASQETVNEKFSVTDHPNLALQQPSLNNYKGKVYVLADGRSFSVSAEFSSIVKTNNRGKFIGEECGGGYYGNTSGTEAFVTLPNTQITLRIPMVKYSMAVKNIGKKVWGIRPDYPVYLTINDIINSKDQQLDYAIKLINNL